MINIAVTYTTHANVSNFLSLSAFSSSTTPTDTVVEGYINEMEDYIDRRCRHAWRTTTITDEYHHLENQYEYGTGIPVFLRHRTVKAMTSGTDKIEAFDGSSWVDWVANKTENRSTGDYWINYTDGIIYFKTLFFRIRADMIRVTYRYGETTVPKDIQHACTLLTAIKILQGEDRSVLLPEGTSNISYSDKIQRWKKEAEDIIDRYVEFIVAGK
mgnify:CR=1 FL=1